MPPENSANVTSNLETINGQEIQLESHATGNKINPKHVIKQNTTLKTASTVETGISSVLKQKKAVNSTNIRRVADKVPSKSAANDPVKPRQAVAERGAVSQDRPRQAVAERGAVSQDRRPGSSSGRRKVVPAHISAPFQTNPNLATSRLQTTYRSATAVKSSVRGRGATGRGRADRGSSGRATSSLSSKSGSAGNPRDKNTNSTTNASNDSRTKERDVERLERESEGLESRDRVRHKEPRNCAGDYRNDKLSPQYTVIEDKTVIERTSGVEQDDAGVGETDNDVDKLFHLRRDG